jgi:hypothetical protein
MTAEQRYIEARNLYSKQEKKIAVDIAKESACKTFDIDPVLFEWFLKAMEKFEIDKYGKVLVFSED